MYELNSRVRYSETDIDAKLSLTGIMNYMQDCSTMQSEDAGVGIGYLEQEKKAWLLSSWQIMIERRPADEIVIRSAREGKSYLVSLCNPDGDVFANIELKEM